MMKDKDTPSYYAILTAEVRYDKRLTPNAKLLYAEITALANQKGYCWSSNSYFAELYGVSTTSISKWISQLIEFGYLESKLIYKQGSKEIQHRYLSLVSTPPIEEKLNTPPRKVKGGIEEKLNTPIEEKLKDNTTSINTTINKSEKEEKIDVDVYEDFKSQIAQEGKTTWIESFYRLFKLKDKTLSKVMDDFILHVKCLPKGQPNTLKEFKIHFYNWCLKVDPMGKLDAYKKHKPKEKGAI